MKKVAIILSGCGVFDGTELNEAVLTMLHLEKQGIQYETFAPDMIQRHVINHFSGEPSNEKRNVLVESNRVTRGNTLNLTDLNIASFDGLILIGGYGVAKNLSSFAIDGSSYQVSFEIEEVINDFYHSKKWILAMCIAPVILAKVIPNASLTIGNDEAAIKALPTPNHKKCDVTEHHVDETNHLITTPAFMLAQNLIELEEGIGNSIKTLSSKISKQQQ